MFSIFAPSPTIYCFETSKTFATSKTFRSAFYFLNELREKLRVLKENLDDQDNESTHFQKYLVISRLIDAFDVKILEFKTLSNLSDEFELSDKLASICLEVMGSRDFQLMGKLRNNDRQHIDEGVKWGSAGIAAGAATLLPATLVGVCIVGGILITAQVARYLTGTNDSRASSANLLVELTRALLEVRHTILTVALNKFALKKDFDEEAVDNHYQELMLACDADYPSEQNKEIEILNVVHVILLKHLQHEKHQPRDYSDEQNERRHRY